MASAFAVTRNHLIFGLCLPLALLLGYLLADAQDPMSLLIVGSAFFILSIPLMMRWYHPVLILCWNMGAQPALPGSPYLWAVVAMLALVFAVVNRAMAEENRLAPVPELARPLLALLLVVGATMVLSGGFGFGALRSGALGGKNYFYMAAAVAGFFVLGSRAIPPARASWYVALFFLPGVLAILPRLAGWIGSGADFVYLLFPPDFELNAVSSLESLGQERLHGVATASTLVFFWVLARVGLAGVFDYSRPWWGALFALLLLGGAAGGYRSTAITMLIVFTIMFCLEKLWRTRVILIMGVLIVIGGGLLVGFADKLPFSLQRTISFLPLKLDAEVQTSAEVSSEWRLEIWREVWQKEVPKYFFRGKGYHINPDDLYMAGFALNAGHWRNWEWAFIAGDYHNGPLSLLVPFGIFGLIAFLWLLIAGTRFLYRQYRDGPPERRRINALLFAVFLGRGLFFLFVYGAIATDLYVFTGILGLSVALNVPARRKGETPPAGELEPTPQI